MHVMSMREDSDAATIPGPLPTSSADGFCGREGSTRVSSSHDQCSASHADCLSSCPSPVAPGTFMHSPIAAVQFTVSVDDFLLARRSVEEACAIRE